MIGHTPSEHDGSIALSSFGWLISSFIHCLPRLTFRPTLLVNHDDVSGTLTALTGCSLIGSR